MLEIFSCKAKTTIDVIKNTNLILIGRMGKSPDELDSDVSDYEKKKNERPPTSLNTTTQKRLKRTKQKFKRKGVKKTKPNRPHLKKRKPLGEEFKSSPVDQEETAAGSAHQHT